MSGYGYCPKCGAKGKSRERRMDGNDTCVKGHKYPSKDALVQKPKFLSGEDWGDVDRNRK